MTISLSSPVTGGAQTGFTAPTYTMTADVAPDALSRQWAVTALGGTQAGVSLHTASSPFTITVKRPASFKTPGPANSNGVVFPAGRNVWKLMTRKGMTPAVNQSPIVGFITTEFSVVAGAEGYDAANIRGAASLHIGSIWQLSAGIGDSLVSGIM